MALKVGLLFDYALATGLLWDDDHWLANGDCDHSFEIRLIVLEFGSLLVLPTETVRGCACLQCLLLRDVSLIPPLEILYTLLQSHPPPSPVRRPFLALVILSTSPFVVGFAPFFFFLFLVFFGAIPFVLVLQVQYCS